MRAPPRTTPPLVKGIPQPNGITAADSKDPIRYYWVEVSEVIKLAKLRGMSVFIHCNNFAPSRDQTGASPEHTRGVTTMGNVKVRKLELYRYLDSAYNAKVSERCLVSIGVSTTCLFVGTF